MSSSKTFIPQGHTKPSSHSSFKRAALAFVALVATLAALAAAPAFAGSDEVIINAGLSGVTINGQTPSGTAVFRQRPGNDLKLEVEVQDVNLPASTVLNVLVGGQQIGTITLDTLRAGKVELETERGQAVPAVTNGTTVAVRNQSGANIVTGTFGSASPTPTPTASPSPTATPGATPSPTPTPGATPTPTPVMNEFEAKLSGATINGTVPKGEAEFETEGANREFKVRIENVNLPAGTALDVLVDGTKVGTITVAPSLMRSELVLKTEDGQTVPQINSRTRVVVADKSGATIVAGSFSNIPPQTTPNPTPTPVPGGEVRIEARLAGAAINGLTPTGHAKFRLRNGNRNFEVEVEKVNLPAGTVLNVLVDGAKVGELVISTTLENEFELESERGQVVPDITTASTVVVTNAQGQTILSGVFNTAGLITQAANDIDATTFFVEQQYRDFLGREADDSGLGFWSSEIAKCNGDAACVEARRVNTSGAFFLSIEFQETGYMLYLFNKASFGTMPRRNDFLVRMQAVAQGVIVGQLGWQEKLAANKQAAAESWVARADFQQRFGSLSNAQYVDALFTNAGVLATDAERNALVQGLNSGAETRATVLRKVADNAEFRRREQNPAFVLMQYFGYLHRNPDEGADSDLSGFNFWRQKLDDNRGDFHKAEMVRAFIEANEYRNRFDW
ncbi:MAG: hypothetical protein QOH49_2250 [Acidobacteriota bacterium]|jgi:hypothetical protein|nr:hypothetical protein [Acidobacteriota bacterium]